jgi:hypothetical protein
MQGQISLVGLQVIHKSQRASARLRTVYNATNFPPRVS